MIQAALNGSRTSAEHPAIPITAAQFAAGTRSAVAAGAGCVHLHARDENGNESVAPEDVARILSAIRAAAPGVPIGVSTGAWIVRDPAERLRLVRAWRTLPDYASVNFHEEGAVPLAQNLLDMGVGVEAGVMNPTAAEALIQSGLANECLRALIEPQEKTVPAALANVEQIEETLNRGDFRPRRLLHGFEITAWTVLEFALTRGYDTRVGLEDVLVLPDGTIADGNAALVSAAVQIAARVKESPNPRTS